MEHYTADAEALFRDFAARHELTIEQINEPNVELLMRLPAQRGLSFELTLGLQNTDELNVGFEGFWSYFFPFAQKHELVKDVLEGLMSGKCRLAVHRQFGVVVERTLEQRSNGSWTTLYTARSSFQLPFVGTQVSYVYNAGVHSR
jgi:hypothetical protein